MDAKTQAHHDARLTRALMRLGAARREKLDKVDYEAFVGGLREFSAELVEQVCGDFARMSPEEYQPRFPPLYLLREACFKAIERANAHRLALKPAPIDELYPQLSDEKWAEIRAKFQEVMNRKVMPPAVSRSGDE